MIYLPGQGWRRKAKCATIPQSPDFFPVGRKAPVVALRACSGCEVKQECLSYALENEIAYGVWGGTTEGQRRKMRLSA